MSNLTNRLKALEEAVAEIVAADQAARDPDKPVQWGSSLEGMADAAIAYASRIESLNPETEKSERIKCFIGLAFCFHWTMGKINGDRSKLESLGPERVRWLCLIVLVCGEKFKELGQRAKPFVNQYGQCDKEQLKAFMDSGAFVV